MNIKEYISSGIVESYVLGLASEEEKLEFERLARQYPELREARFSFELSLEEKLFADAITPAPHLREKVLDLLKQETAVQSALEIVSKPVKAPVKKISYMRWAVAACVILMLGCGYMIYMFLSVNNKLKQDIASSKTKIDQLAEKQRAFEEKIIPGDSKIKQVNVVTPQQAIPPAIQVFWDSTSSNVYLLIRNLVKLPEGQRYELWSVTKGKHQSLGRFDATDDDKLIMKMNNVQDAESFAITIVKEKPAQ